MKKYLKLLSHFFVFLLVAQSSYSQTGLKSIDQKQLDSLYDIFPKVDGEIEIEKVIHLDSSFTTKILYKNAILFFTNEFREAKSVIQYNDSTEGRIIGKGN